MAELAEATEEQPAGAPRSLGQTIRKRWRAWLRAVHRDIGYLAIGFTVIYALSGIAMNHIDDWDPNFTATERTVQIAPIPDDVSDDEAVQRVTQPLGLGKPDEVFRAGDEVRLTYTNGTHVTAIADTVTVQARSSRWFFRAAVWLHATRGKAAWKYISDAYAVLLIYLAISGIFMIRGKLGLRWRGTIFILVGLGAPLGYLVASGGPEAHKPDDKFARPAAPTGIRFLPPDEDATPTPTEHPSSRSLPAAELPARGTLPVR